MVQELVGCRDIALSVIPLLYSSHYGLNAGLGRYEAFYSRDFERFTDLALRHPSNLTPELEAMLEVSFNTIFTLQGKEPVSPTDDQAPGRVIHQWQNGWTPKERMDELLADGWTPYINEHGETEIRYYGAGDTTSGAILAASRFAEAKRVIYDSVVPRDEFLSQFWVQLKAANYHEIRREDIDGDGLIESVPKDKRRLLHHTERDSDYAYDLEDGTRPLPPFKYLSNNSIFLAGLREFGKMAELAGESNLVKESREGFEDGLARYNEIYWMEEEGYMSPLVYGDQQKRANIISDEAIDAMYYGLVDAAKAKRIVDRFMQPDIMTPYGPWTRSKNSTQFAENDAKAYWRGATIWPQRVAIAAEAMEAYGYHTQARVLDQALGNYFRIAGLSELAVVDRFENLVPYTEDGIAKACNPHLFAVGAILARTANPESQPPVTPDKPSSNFPSVVRK